MSEWLSDLSDLEAMTAGAIYLAVLVLVFVESGLLVGVIFPGDSLVFTAGLLSADPDRGLNMPLLAAGVFVAAVSGDAVGYWTGRRFGRPWLMRRAKRAAPHVERAERFYEKYGMLAVIIARFIPWVRTLTPIVAGVARMPYPRFFVANVLGGLLWGSGLVVLGYFAYSDPRVRALAYAIAGTAIALSLLMPLIARVRRARAARATARRAPGSQAPRSEGAAQEPATAAEPTTDPSRNRS